MIGDGQCYTLKFKRAFQHQLELPLRIQRKGLFRAVVGVLQQT